MKTTKEQRKEWRKICEASVKDMEWFPAGTMTAEPAVHTLALLDDIDELRAALETQVRETARRSGVDSDRQNMISNGKPYWMKFATQQAYEALEEPQ